MWTEVAVLLGLLLLILLNEIEKKLELPYKKEEKLGDSDQTVKT